MPRKKVVIQNELESASVESVSDIHDLETDDIVMGELSEEEQQAAAELLKQMDSRTKINASKRGKKNLYSGEMLHITDEEDLSRLVTEEDARYEVFQKLNQSLVSGAILKGTIIKSVSRNRDPEHPEMPTAIVRFENDDYFEVKIPFTDFLPKDRLPEIRGETAADKLNYMDLLINMRTGSDVYFIVQKLDEATGEVLASRTKAMSKLIRERWFERRRDGSFVIEVGAKVVANIMYVDRTRICVDAMGIEQNIDISDISWIRYYDLRNAPLKKFKDSRGRLSAGSYHAGDLIEVRVMGLKRTFYELVPDEARPGRYKIKTGENGSPVILDENEIEGRPVRPAGIKVKLSAKACTKNPDEKNFDKFSIGERVEAEITHVDENGIFCMLAGMRSGKILFSGDNTDIPTVGTRCLVRITNMNPKEYKINCEIVQSYR